MLTATFSFRQPLRLDRVTRRWLLLGALVLLVGGVCAVLPAGAGAAGSLAGPAVVPHRSPGVRIAWKGCGKRLQCARVRVPLDWARPTGAKISLAVIRHLASRPGRRIGSMFFNPGGPGESGVELVGDNGSELDAWGGGRFDLVSWDRGEPTPATPCAASPAKKARRGSGERGASGPHLDRGQRA
jgi:hypothetical protein